MNEHTFTVTVRSNLTVNEVADLISDALDLETDSYTVQEVSNA